MSEINTLFGIEQQSAKKTNTQVYQVTHNGAGTRLPLMKRSFISFTYGGKNIEDFGLISIIESNSMERSLYAEFDDNTTDLKVVDGQLYWSSHFKANELSLGLFTDEITERQLATFQQWFKPGFCRELILAEHPNRAIMARIKDQPKYKVLPFEKQITSRLYGTKTSTTVYRGKIEITFIMDDPFWYAIDNILDSEETGKWKNPSTKTLETIASSKDALKIIEEDGIPTIASLKSDTLIGNDVGVTVTERAARTARADEFEITDVTLIPEIFVGYAKIGGTVEVDRSGSSFSLADGAVKYFYYAGTAPCYPILEFTINFITDGENYCNTLSNSYISNNSKQYNSIEIESITEPRKLLITTPGFITAYNQVIKIFKTDNISNIERPEHFRDDVNHYKMRSLAIGNSFNTVFTTLQSTTQGRFRINCKTGEVEVTYILPNGVTFTENAGDMIRSNYLKIEDRNYPDEYGYVQNWTIEHPEYSHKLSHDIPSGLSNVKLTYEYMYL